MWQHVVLCRSSVVRSVPTPLRNRAGGGEAVHLHSFLSSALDMVGGQRNNPAPLTTPPPIPNKWEAGWAQQPVWTFWGTGNLLPLQGLEPRTVQPRSYTDYLLVPKVIKLLAHLVYSQKFYKSDQNRICSTVIATLETYLPLRLAYAVSKMTVQRAVKLHITSPDFELICWLVRSYRRAVKQ